MELFEAIRERASYRGEYLPDKVPFTDLEKIVRAGMAAPSGRNMQTTAFVIVDDEDLLSGIGRILPSQLTGSAPAMIVAAYGEDPDDFFASEREDCAAAVQNMLLAMTALGYASCWIDGEIRLRGRAEAIGMLLDLPEGITARVILPVGKAASAAKQPAKLGFDQRAYHNQYR